MAKINENRDLMTEFIKKIPKAELHIHIEGSLEPKMMFDLAKKNNIDISYKNIDDIKKAYDFSNLQSFLDIYYAGANVLITKQDFYDLTWAYILKCKENNIVHSEIFFDPQTHLNRGIKFETVILGISNALKDAKEKFGITSNIIICFLRHLSQEDAFKIYEESLAYKKYIIGIGLDSAELNNPPSKFKELFKRAKDDGFKLVAHAGEEAEFPYIYEALDILNVDRIDHGVQSSKSKDLMNRLKEEQIPLTVCPNSNIELKVFSNMKDHNIKILLDYGLNISVNSDDPAYFKGYLNDNFLAIYESLKLSKSDIVKLVKNSFKSSFLSDELKEKYILDIDNFVENNK